MPKKSPQRKFATFSAAFRNINFIVRFSVIKPSIRPSKIINQDKKITPPKRGREVRSAKKPREESGIGLIAFRVIAELAKPFERIRSAGVRDMPVMHLDEESRLIRRAKGLTFAGARIAQTIITASKQSHILTPFLSK